jgi:tRNA threonylcarbamoyl adenosine modification protein YeaZ
MRLLAVDTALEACSVAVVGNGRQSVVLSENVGRGHAERLFGMIDSAMVEAGFDFADLDRIAVTVGPGSFTGVRVGIAAARGLALVVGCPVVGIGTLEVHAASARALAGAVPVVAVLDARRGEVYSQRFALAGAAVAAPTAGSPESVAAQLADGDVLAGAGADMVAAALPSCRRAPIAHRRSAPDVSVLAEIAAAATAPEAAPRPVYLRPPDARPQATAGVARR